jgi:hypothetical protein
MADRADRAAGAVLRVLGVEAAPALRAKVADEIRRVMGEPDRPAPALQPMTQVQRETLVWWGDYIQAHKVAPTMQEAGDHFGVSKVSVHERVLALVKKGHMIRSDAGTRRYVIAPGVDVEAYRSGAIVAARPASAAVSDE